MTQKVVVRALSVSLDGYSAGPNQSLENPLGVGGPEAFDWFFHTRTWTKMHGLQPEGEGGIDDDVSAKSFENIGAWILGRNMFGPIRGPWPDENWKGWWGDEPPYHVPIFVLTHYPRASFTMQGNNTFHFVTDGIESALAQAKKAANGKDVRIGGGPATIRQYLKARLIDELHFAIAPALLGSGESIFAGVNLRELGYECVRHVAGKRAVAHVFLEKRV